MSKYIPGNQKHLTLEDCKYKECLSQSRAGINITRHELHQEDMVITPLIFQGQSPYQIITNHPELDMSVRTLYSYLDKGILSARNIDLKRQVKFNPRKVHKTQIKDRSVFIRRMFSDFQALELDHFAEMDTVHSSQDSKRVILTFFLTREKLKLYSTLLEKSLCFLCVITFLCSENLYVHAICCPWFHATPLQSSQSMSHPPAATLRPPDAPLSAILHPLLPLG